MKTRHSAILIGTHLLALGAGWWALRDSAVAADPLPALAGKTERSPRQERRGDTAELLAAYNNSDFWMEAQQRRSAAEEEPPASAASPVFNTPEERAAEIADIPGALQQELESVNAGKAYDYQLAMALIFRWMKEDAAACAAWLGRMNSRVGWGDPFNAFAGALPPLELIGLMDGWLQVNRNRALSAIAERVGRENASELPVLLARLGADEAKGLLENAANHARVEDAALWLSVVGDDPNRLALLARQWIQGPGTDWEWRELRLMPDYKVEFVLGRSLNALAKEDPQAAAALLGELPPGTRREIHGTLFDASNGS